MAWALARSSFMTSDLSIDIFFRIGPLTYSPFGDDWPRSQRDSHSPDGNLLH